MVFVACPDLAEGVLAATVSQRSKGQQCRPGQEVVNLAATPQIEPLAFAAYSLSDAIVCFRPCAGYRQIRSTVIQAIFGTEFLGGRRAISTAARRRPANHCVRGGTRATARLS